MGFEYEQAVGISALSCYLPRLRVDLRQWCEWTSHDWGKVAAVTGRAFRMAGPDEDVYTMAATAVLRLVLDNGIEPRRIGFLALGTESSTDNAFGAVIVRGMIDRELRRRGMPTLPRDVEVPEYKHACLSGMYALQGAARFALLDRDGRQAVVVASDVAEYERGSSGEQTQGAGAVAMLVERSPALLTIDLGRAAGASAYRGPDFRKPAARHRVDGYAARTQRLSDFPVFSGRYSATAYLDAVTSAVETLWAADAVAPSEQLESLQAVFMHRPYRRLPLQALSFLQVRAMAASPQRHVELELLCRGCDTTIDDVLAELRVETDLYRCVLAGQQAPEPWPATSAVSAHLRGQPAFHEFAQRTLGSGADLLEEVGNLYSASLPAWLAAGVEEAARQGVELAGAPLLAVGYGSGDAALALPVTAVDGWQAAAARIGFRRSLGHPVDLDREQYEALHDRREVPGLALHPLEQFTVDRTGTEYGRDFQDLAVDYYAYEY